MNPRALVIIGFVFLSGLMLSAATADWKAPVAADGHPDLQGTWTNGFATPLERPRDLAGKAFFTEQEAAQYEKTLSERPASNNDVVSDPSIWWEKGTKVVPSRRTSLVVDPPDGHVPPLTPEAQKMTAAIRAETRKHPDSGPEDRSLQERCIVWPNGGPVPMLPSPYNNNYQIVQTPDYVIIVVEMNHDVRIIPIDKSPAGGEHLIPGLQQWLGDSRGHWEGGTLVVDTTNFTDRTRFHGSDEKLHMIERFSRQGPTTLLYQFTVDDPTAFTKQWTAEIPMVPSDGPLYEFACHEGNEAMANMLRTARLAEQSGKK